MRLQEKEPFLPFITVDDIVRFNPDDEETYTESRFINAVLRTIHRVGAADTQRIFISSPRHRIRLTKRS